MHPCEYPRNVRLTVTQRGLCRAARIRIVANDADCPVGGPSDFRRKHCEQLRFGDGLEGHAVPRRDGLPPPSMISGPSGPVVDRCTVVSNVNLRRDLPRDESLECGIGVAHRLVRDIINYRSRGRGFRHRHRRPTRRLPLYCDVGIRSFDHGLREKRE